MTPTQRGGIRLFRLWGIDVFLHWSWFIVAAIELTSRTERYSSPFWNVLEYLTLFLIVLMHEFGHALACRQVGGRADQIVLWPLGGVAYVNPPPRPGAMLWSIAAGPLVNVALCPILGSLWIAAGAMEWADTLPNAYAFLGDIFIVNLIVLIFNVLPIYPLDGGQILRSLLWFAVGRAYSLMAAAAVGILGALGLIGLTLWIQDLWLGVISVFILMNSFGGLLQADLMRRVAQAPRHPGTACPACGSAPPVGAFWPCPNCRKTFDTFATQAVCPHCRFSFAVTQCWDCGGARPMSEWITSRGAAD
ncbi:MAG: M50 family metallopeptidase [Planctomycetes bacterium]|nr:M50 family metallopeptidase [Planctomycetota bacterium]